MGSISTSRLLGTLFVACLLGAAAYQVFAASHGRGQQEERGSSVGQAARDATLEAREAAASARLERAHERGQHSGDTHDDVPPGLLRKAAREANPFVTVQPSSHHGRLRACQAREHAVERRSEHLVRLATHMLAVFDRIAEHVKTFYTTVVVPGGQTVPTYDALLAAIEARKAAVDAALAQATEAKESFSCGHDDPKAAVQQFRQDMQAVKRALHELRRAVRDLIVAVRGVAGLIPSSPTLSPGPTFVPTPTESIGPSPTISSSPNP